MSEEQLKLFLMKVKGDLTLQDKLKAAADADTVSQIAKDEGFLVPPGILLNPLSPNQEFDLTDEEVEDVAGGGRPCRLTCLGSGASAAGLCPHPTTPSIKNPPC
ncbi:Nif11-like leader peptide family natural product precursor [Synechococcus sp. UW105]|uniref:Nif11-like leader peptide family natural product precursor n=1 Tax=Synechococcus sp. UW105 TaxID=337067 RepID=UPI000E0F4CB5|nr:Nif11-like leader peptide family natural product precursor [Synechococcus sp. UW105]